MKLRYHNLVIILIAFIFVHATYVPPLVFAQEYVDNEVLVKFTDEGEAAIFASDKRDISLDNFLDWLKGTKRKRQNMASLYSDVITKLGVTETESLERDGQPETGSKGSLQLGYIPNPTVNSSITDPLENVYLLKFSSSTVEQAVSQLKQLEFIIYAQPNYFYKATAFEPNDPLFPQQWEYEQIQLPDAWEITREADVLVAVLDSGVDFNHKELKNVKFWQEDVTMNGKKYTNARGWDFIDNDPEPLDTTNGHGTGTSGVIAATANNSGGIAGVVHGKITLLEIRVLGSDGLGTSTTVAQGIRFAVDHNANILSMSIGDKDSVCAASDQIINDVTAYSASAGDALVIMSAGNDKEHSECRFPHGNQELLVISASTREDKPADYSGFAPISWKNELILSAPGGSIDGLIIILLPNDQYGRAAGTSISAPQVSGTAALMLGINPDLSWEQLRTLLIVTADEMEGSDFWLNGQQYTYGKRLNALKALKAVTDGVELTPTPTEGSTTPIPTGTASDPTPTPAVMPTTAPALGGSVVRQVDWVWDNDGQGRCWSAWAGSSCSLLSHEGGAPLAARDLDHDGVTDIECSQGSGAGQTTTIKNVSSKTYTFRCEQYECASCTTGNGTHVQCDGGIDSGAKKKVLTIELKPSETKVCGYNGVDDPVAPTPTPTPTEDPLITPTTTPTEGAIPTVTPTGSAEPTPTGTEDTNADIISAISLITAANIEESLRNLVDDDDQAGVDQLQTRYFATTGNTTEQAYLVNRLKELGLNVSVQEFNPSSTGPVTYPSGTGYNVIATLEGNSAETYLVTAHLDSTSARDDADKDPAPGADDNGSGVSAVVEVARAVTAMAEKGKLPYTVEFVLFDAEEIGLVGSSYYAGNLGARLSQIKGVYNLDMVGYKKDSSQACAQFGYQQENTYARTMAEVLHQIVTKYNINLDITSGTSDNGNSDHASFWRRDIPALFGFECEFNEERYHTTADKLEEVDYNQIMQVSKVVSAGLLELMKID